MLELWYRHDGAGISDSEFGGPDRGSIVQSMAQERLYSITEAAQKLGVSPATIATWIRLGIATASRQDEIGRNRYTDADLAEMERRFQERQERKRGGRTEPRSRDLPPAD
jgi:uncharacterized protein YjcR